MPSFKASRVTEQLEVSHSEFKSTHAFLIGESFAQEKTYFWYKMRRFQNFEKNSAWHWRNFASNICYEFRNHNFHHVVIKQRNKLAIFGPFLDLEEFFKNRGLSFETCKSYFKVPINYLKNRGTRCLAFFDFQASLWEIPK